MRFACLGSGSKGNAWLIEAGATRVLLDCGFAQREAVRRLARLEVEADSIDAIVVTHEHGDHGRGVAAFAARHGATVHVTHGCHAMLTANAGLGAARIIDSHAPFAIGDLTLQPYPVPHDAREPVQFTFADGARKLAVLTDVGHVTGHMRDQLRDCDGLVIECNHDVEKLRAGNYPAALKARILGPFGHLDNAAGAELLAAVAHPKLQHVVAAHLSEENNTPDLARAALAGALGCAADWIGVAGQETGLEWRSLC